MNDDVNKREQISALVDGALQGDGWAQAVQSASDEEGQATWQMYHLIGDVLRSPDLAPPCDTALLQRLRGQIAQEPRPPSVVPAPPAVLWPVPGGAGDASRAPEAANAAVFRWKMAAGVASLAAVVAVGWSALVGLQGAAPGGQLASASAPSAPKTAPVVAVAEREGAQVMLRDPRLDELMAAHQQFGATSTLQMPAGFLRNATFDRPQR